MPEDHDALELMRDAAMTIQDTTKTSVTVVEDKEGNRTMWWNGKVADINWLLEQCKAALLKKHPLLCPHQSEEDYDET
jgi:hypothetical protein